MAPYSELVHPERGSISLHDVMFALSAPERLDLVRQLREGPMAAAQCSTIDPDMPKSTKSHQLKVLRESGVIYNEPDGRNRKLSLRRTDLDARFPGLLDAVLSSADGPEPDSSATVPRPDSSTGTPAAPTGEPAPVRFARTD